MASANERLQDDAIAHLVDLSRYSSSVVAKIIGLLNRSDIRLAAELASALAQIEPSSFTIERLESLLYSVRSLNRTAYEQVDRELTAELRDFANYEASYQTEVLRSALPQAVRVATVTGEQAYAAALSRPFQGALLKGWIADQEAGRAKKIRQVVAQGFVENKTTDQIIREIRGTKAKGYKDGVLEISRRDAEAVVRTAISHMAGTVQDRIAEANTDLVKAVRWCATLDVRTSSICRIRDGLRYEPVSHKPIGHKLPWLAGPGRAHWRCRSAQVMVTKSWAELSGIEGLPEFTPSERASMDGAVPADLSYGDWLKKQSAARQDDVLGATRGKLLRDGGLFLEDMYSAKGSPLTLDEMRRRDAQAFKRAGL